jgi:GTPase SAR1 family protein
MTGAEFVGPGLEVAGWAIPKGFALARSWWIGKEILIIGQPRAGKTTFRDYLQYGLFEATKETEETPEIEPSDRFDVGSIGNGTLRLVVSSAVDVPGQVGAVAQANWAFERNPHALIVFLDLTTPLDGEPDRASGAWLLRFCKRYESKWRVDRKRNNRLNSIIVVMNKADKVDEPTIAVHAKAYRDTVERELKDAKGRMSNGVATMPCSVVENPKGTKLVDSVIAQLAKAFKRA